jgi:acyl carrier protein
MELNEFVLKFSEQFENTEESIFKPDTVYKELEEWSSLVALSVLAMILEEYRVKLAGDDIRSSVTIVDLYKKVKEKHGT